MERTHSKTNGVLNKVGSAFIGGKPPRNEMLNDSISLPRRKFSEHLRPVVVERKPKPKQVLASGWHAPTDRE